MASDKARPTRDQDPHSRILSHCVQPTADENRRRNVNFQKQYNAMRGNAMGESLLIAPAFSSPSRELRLELVKTRSPGPGLITADLHPRHYMSGSACTRLT
jgi:hypothetical protein